VVESSFFNQDDFTNALSMLPVVSIDLIISDKKGNVLLGKRENRPARGSWFVPGGRIRRMENFEDAFKRISESELGMQYSLVDVSFFGIFEHMYEDSAFSDVVGSHYVSIAFKINGENIEMSNLPKNQHQDYAWFSVNSLNQEDSIHERTKEFFDSKIGIR
tara:strand:+ start:804 stop:1286 length:483 start_codon:yes stop_codon:yes gene_type:complete